MVLRKAYLFWVRSAFFADWEWWGAVVQSSYKRGAWHQRARYKYIYTHTRSCNLHTQTHKSLIGWMDGGLCAGAISNNSDSVPSLGTSVNESIKSSLTERKSQFKRVEIVVCYYHHTTSSFQWGFIITEKRRRRMRWVGTFYSRQHPKKCCVTFLRVYWEKSSYRMAQEKKKKRRPLC